MRDIKLKTNYKPLALVLQIEPSDASLMEASLVCQVDANGNTFRHDLWWQNMPPKTRLAAQKLIIEAIDSLVREDSIHKENE